MIPQTCYAVDEKGISDAHLREILTASLADCREKLRKVLLLPPDFTRLHSLAGSICNIYYHLLKDTCQVDIMPAVGTHLPVTREQAAAMFGDIPFDCFLAHNWRTDVVKLGEVPASFVKEVSEGVMEEAIPVEVNHLLVDGGYDLILSVGQVVPHEVVGMANYSKNIFVGVGGSGMINASHMLGAFYGMERMMGRDHTPVRKVFDYAHEHYLKDLPLQFVQTVTTAEGNDISFHGIFVAEGRVSFEKAVALAQKKNLTFVEKPLKKVVVYMNPEEFHTTWIGNKAIYRTRMAIADGGELLILAPGVWRFGEDEKIDGLIQKYGYCGRENVIRLFRENKDLQENQGAAAHLIHGSPDGRFTVTYAVEKISREEIESVCFRSADYEETARRYDPHTLRYGYNTMPDGEEIYFIPNPALGLWATEGSI